MQRRNILRRNQSVKPELSVDSCEEERKDGELFENDQAVSDSDSFDKNEELDEEDYEDQINDIRVKKRKRRE